MEEERTEKYAQEIPIGSEILLDETSKALREFRKPNFALRGKDDKEGRENDRGRELDA